MQGCSDYTNPRSFLTNSSAIFAGFDDHILKAGLYEPVCGEELLASAQKPLMIGSLLHEWTVFDSQYGREYYGSPMQVAEAFLSSRLSGYSSASAKLQSCALEELKKPYVNLSWPCENEDCALDQLVSDLSFTIG